MVEFAELMITRRSVRNFEERDVPLDVIHDIITDSCMAPSASDRQPWQFIIVNNREWIKKLSDESKAHLLVDLERKPSALLKSYEPLLRNETFNVFYNAPCLVYIAGSKEVRSLDLDCTLAASYFMFSAASRGLGTCWIALGSRVKNGDIGLSDDERIIAPIILGYPKRIPKPPERKAPHIVKIIQ